MPSKKVISVDEKALADARRRAAETRQLVQDNPAVGLLTAQEQAEAAPFYFVVRGYIQELKEAREAAKLTLGDISARTGLAVESLSRLETGALTNPTWKTLGLYAAALNLRPYLSVVPTPSANQAG